MQDVRLIVKGAVSGIKDGESHVTLTLTGAVAQAGNRSAGFDRIEAVSYTHLDVYKRQGGEPWSRICLLMEKNQEIKPQEGVSYEI